MYPVFFHDNPNSDWPELEVGKWYFYDETGANAEGPFESRLEAETALKVYCQHLSACPSGACES